MYYKTLILCLSVLGLCSADETCTWEYGEYSCQDVQLNTLKNPHKGRVVKLSIRNSNLREIHENAFTDFPSIMVLDLQGNGIEQVNSGAFNGLPNLFLIILSRNNLTSFSLSGMGKVNHLYINHNKISNLDLKLDSLVTLYMNNNLVTNLNFLQHLPKLEELSVKGNQLSCEDGTVWQDIPLKKVELSNNPWQKGCVNSLVTLFEGRNVKITDKNDLDLQ